MSTLNVLLLFSCLVVIESLAVPRKPVPVFFDSSNGLHRSLTYHPEQPARVEACVKALQEEEENENFDIDLIDVAPEGYRAKSEDCPWLPVTQNEPITSDELERARKILLKIHNPEVITNLERRCRDSKQRRIDEGKDPLGFVGYIDDDTYVTTETYDVCLRATATWMRGVDFLFRDKKTTTTTTTTTTTAAAMALTRPPGHHATTNTSNGFCLFNFAAAAAIYYQTLRPNARISILDWDVHYGQGVADIVAPFKSVRYASIHQVPSFPYEGTKKEIRNGNILTIPMTAETTWTCGYQQYFQDALNFLFNNHDDDYWQPTLVIVCAGYDALDSDELASVSLNAKDYGKMTRSLLRKMEESTTSKSSPAVLFGLEGGYQLRTMAGGGNLQQAVVETVKALMD